MTITRVFDVLDVWRGNNRNNTAFVKLRNNNEEPTSSQYFVNEVDALSRALIYRGVKPEENILLILNNGIEWNIIDLACSQIGAIPISLYADTSDIDLQFIIRQADPKLIFVENQSLYHRVTSIAQALKTIEQVYTISETPEAYFWHDLIAHDDEQNLALHTKLDYRKETISPNDIYSILYIPDPVQGIKGVVLTHKNIIQSLQSYTEKFEFNSHERTLSLVSQNHIFGRIANYLYLSQGVTIYYPESPQTLMRDLLKARPHTLFSVPEPIIQTYQNLAKYELELTSFKRHIFNECLKIATRNSLNLQPSLWKKVQEFAVRKLILRRLQANLGGKLKYCVIGGAQICEKIDTLFKTAKIPLHQTFGSAETAYALCLTTNPLRQQKDYTRINFGPEIQIKVAPDNEILLQSNSVMLAYYKSPELSKNIFEGAWLKTGCIGKLVSDSLVQITHEKSILFHLSNARSVNPETIEKQINTSNFISKSIVLGSNKRFLIALILPNFDQLTTWATKSNITYNSNEELTQLAPVRSKYRTEINRYNQQHRDFEAIVDFELLPQTWSTATGELTQNGELNRMLIQEKYERIITELQCGELCF